MNNAGFFPDDFSLTKDGIENCFQTNHLSHMLLSFLLLDHFEKNNAKIINLSSMNHQLSDYSEKSILDYRNQKDFSDYETKYYRNVMGKNLLYANTKLANVYFTQYFSDYLEKFNPNIKTASVHPGAVNTEFSRFIKEYMYLNFLFYIFYPLVTLVMKTSLAGAQTQLHLSYIDNGSLVNGAYYKDCQISKTSKLSMNEKVRNAFINYSLEIIFSHVDEYVLQDLKSKNIKLINENLC